MLRLANSYLLPSLLSIILLIILSIHFLLILFLFFLLPFSLPTLIFIFKALVFIIIVIIHLVSIKISIIFFIIVFIRNFWLDFFYFFLHFNLDVSCFEVFHQAFQFISFNTHKLNCFLFLYEGDFHVKLLIICSQSTKLNFSYLFAFEVDNWLGDEDHGLL